LTNSVDIKERGVLTEREKILGQKFKPLINRNYSRPKAIPEP